ncbi:hypothetical protein RFI_05566, partial [Reticulomyxa filosa]
MDSPMTNDQLLLQQQQPQKKKENSVNKKAFPPTPIPNNENRKRNTLTPAADKQPTANRLSTVESIAHFREDSVSNSADEIIPSLVIGLDNTLDNIFTQ